MLDVELVLGLLGLAAYLIAGGYAAVQGWRWWIELWRDAPPPPARGDRLEKDELYARAALYGRRSGTVDGLGGGAP